MLVGRKFEGWRIGGCKGEGCRKGELIGRMIPWVK